MTRFLPTLACLLVAANSGLKAERMIPQGVYAPGLEWLWWGSACAFLWTGIATWLRGAE